MMEGSSNDGGSSNDVGTITVNVKLDNIDANSGDYTVTVTVYGDAKLHKSKNVDTSGQTCRDDIDSQCYTPAGPFKFLASQVPIGSEVEVCVQEPISDEEECNSGKNTSKDGAETIGVGVPDIP